MNDLIKRKKEIEEEFDEILEMDSDLNNTKSNMTIATVGNLLKKFNEVVGDLVEILSKKDNYDTTLKGVIENAIGQVADKFSQIQPPTITVAPNVSIDLKPIYSIATDISKQSATLISLVSKYNNTQGEQLYKLITGIAEKQITLLERELKQFDYTNELKTIGEGINNRPTEFETNVTAYNEFGRIKTFITKIIR